ncbi:MAG: hypothetical protein AAF410_00290 [Pseudomonadota bacterium]
MRFAKMDYYKTAGKAVVISLFFAFIVTYLLFSFLPKSLAIIAIPIMVVMMSVFLTMIFFVKKINRESDVLISLGKSKKAQLYLNDDNICHWQTLGWIQNWLQE